VLKKDNGPCRCKKCCQLTKVSLSTKGHWIRVVQSSKERLHGVVSRKKFEVVLHLVWSNMPLAKHDASVTFTVSCEWSTSTFSV
jgi:hypothetical protein